MAVMGLNESRDLFQKIMQNAIVYAKRGKGIFYKVHTLPHHIKKGLNCNVLFYHLPQS